MIAVDVPGMTACCGLDCESCEIRQLPFDQESARVVVDWFHRQGWLKPEEGAAEALERRMYCLGCREDRTLHWSADCWILQCCVDEHGLQHCSACAAFPCQRLEEWAKQNDSYGEALERLKGMAQVENGAG